MGTVGSEQHGCHCLAQGGLSMDSRHPGAERVGVRACLGVGVRACLEVGVRTCLGVGVYV